ncbi:MAG: hypothetical protein IPH82_26690 [Chloroflexi bacterium]|nr:hypothetical protein [Chloroflexota bacterium]
MRHKRQIVPQGDGRLCFSETCSPIWSLPFTGADRCRLMMPWPTSTSWRVTALFILAPGRAFCTIPTSAAVVRGLPLLAAVHLRVPRLPARLLETILADARRARRSDGAFSKRCTNSTTTARQCR